MSAVHQAGENMCHRSHSCACTHQPVTYKEDRKKRSFRELEKLSLELVCSSTLGGSSQGSISSTTPCPAATKMYTKKREIISPDRQQERSGNNVVGFFFSFFFFNAKPNQTLNMNFESCYNTDNKPIMYQWRRDLES